MALLEGELDEILASAVDKSLDSMGRGFMSIFYWSLENRMGIKRSQIASKPEEFIAYLERMFPAGHLQVKEEISEELLKRLRFRNSGDLVKLIKRLGRDESRIREQLSKYDNDLISFLR